MGHGHIISATCKLSQRSQLHGAGNHGVCACNIPQGDESHHQMPDYSCGSVLGARSCEHLLRGRGAHSTPRCHAGCSMLYMHKAFTMLKKRDSLTMGAATTLPAWNGAFDNGRV